MGQDFQHIQNVFNRGVLSPRLIGRSDNEAYYKAVKDSDNMIPYPQGSITRRPSSIFVKEVKNSSLKTRLIPFRFSVVQNYIIELGNQYIRFYRNRGNVESSPGVAYEVATPWLTAELDALKFTQSYDTLFVAHPNHQVRKITRTSDTSWSVSNLNYGDGPYLPTNITATTITPSAATGAITLTASAALFTAGDVGRWMRIKVGGSNWGYVNITSFTSSTLVNATVVNTLTTTGATTNWRFSYFGGSFGHPSSVGIYEERMVLGGTVNHPATLFFSKTGDFENYADSSLTGTVVDDDGFSVTIGDDQVNNISWLSAGRVLLVGTSGAEYSVTGGSASGNQAITPDNVTIKRETRTGSSANVRAHRIGSAVLYISYTGRKIQEINYDFGIDSFVSRDATIFNNHLTFGGIVDVDFQQEEDPILWLVRADGKLLSFTYERLQQIEGISPHTIGGTDAAVESVACIPSPLINKDDVWIIVKRTINGSTKRYIEYLGDYSEYLNQEDMIFVDSALTYNGYLSGTITPAATSGSGINFHSSAAVFTAGMVGDKIRSGTSQATVTAFVDSSNLTCTIDVDFPSTAAIPTGSWSFAVNAVSGLGHLEAETVSIFADGGVVDSQTVSSGAISLPFFFSKIHAGLSCPWSLKLLPVEVRQFNTVMGRIRTTNKIHVYFTKTLGVNCGSSPVSFQELVPFNVIGQPLGVAPPMLTGIRTFHPPSGYDKEGELIFSGSQPTPVTINYVSQYVTFNG